MMHLEFLFAHIEFCVWEGDDTIVEERILLGVCVGCKFRGIVSALSAVAYYVPGVRVGGFKLFSLVRPFIVSGVQVH